MTTATKAMKATPRGIGNTIVQLLNAVDEYVHLETYEGTHREGRMSGFRTREIDVDGQAVEWPLAIELNGDSGDTVELQQIKTIRFSDAKRS